MRDPFAHEGTRATPHLERSIWLYITDLKGLRFFLLTCDRLRAYVPYRQLFRFGT
jgi:hypothetical protein